MRQDAAKLPPAPVWREVLDEVVVEESDSPDLVGLDHPVELGREVDIGVGVRVPHVDQDSAQSVTNI